MTRNICPRLDGEGQIGTEEKSWAKGNFKKLFVEGVQTDQLKATSAEVKNIGAEEINVQSIVLSGDSTVPTQKTGDKSRKVASTEYVDAGIQLLIENYKKSLIALSPAHYARSTRWEANRSKIVVPDYMTINIGENGYVHNGTVTIDINNESNWDNNAYSTPANRKGKDFYIYACQPNIGTVPKILLSANSTVPSGYNEKNSRKIGGFHCECADVGIINQHPLSGYIAGDILPKSMWDLNHRPMSAPEGMVFDGNKWIDIYLNSWDGNKLISTYNGVIADGESAKRFSGELFEEELRRIGKFLPLRNDYIHFAKGSNEGTNIAGSKDPNTTGGHKDTNGRRMISNIGCEDCCGVLWQWTGDWWENSPAIKTGTTLNPGPTYDATKYNDKTEDRWLHNIGYGMWSDYSVTNKDVDGSKEYGQTWGIVIRARVGGGWGDGSRCGSRSADLAYFSSIAESDAACRGASEPRPAAT